MIDCKPRDVGRRQVAKRTILRRHVTELLMHIMLGHVEHVSNDREPWWSWRKRQRAAATPFRPPKDCGDNHWHGEV